MCRDSNAASFISLCKPVLRRHLRILWLFLLLLKGDPTSAQFFLEGSARTETVDFEYIKNLIVVSLKINNRGPYNFVLDSGVGVFLISDHSLVDSLDLKNLRKIKIMGFGEGKELDASVTGNLYVTLGEDINGILPAAVLGEDSFDLSSYIGRPIHGFLGYEFFNSFSVKINYLDKTIRVFDPNYRYKLRNSTKLPLTINSNKPYIEASVRLNEGGQVPVKLIIDSGAGHPLWLESIDGKTVKVPEPKIRANLGVGLNGSIGGYMARISWLQLGIYRLQNIVSAFPDFEDVGSRVEVNRSGNLGNAVLKRFTVIFDYKRHYLVLKPNAEIKKSFDHDMSGLELVYHAPDFKRLFIGKVEDGSSAEAMNLLAGDEILSINLKPAKDWDIDELYHLFRSKPGRNIVFSVLPKGGIKAQTVILTLRRRI